MPLVERTPPLDPDADATAQLARRLRIATTLCIGPILLFALFDLALSPRQQLPIYWAIKAAALVVIGIAVILLRQRTVYTRRRLVAVGLCCVAALYGLSTTSAVLARETQTTGLLAVSIALATATLLPWGVVAQAAVVGLGVLSTALAFYGADGQLHGLMQYHTVGLVIAMGVSIYVALEFERSRGALAQRRDEQRRADAEVRRLNEELEARVRERTSELERVNRDLQHEVEERIRYAAELRRSEEAARQRQAELTHVQRLSTLGEMAAGLAHEINQPLSAIVNYARGCAHRLRADPASLPEVLPALDSISTEALRAGEVIRRLRQLVRKETPRQEAIDINLLVSESLRIIVTDARQADIEIEEFPAATLPLVKGDPIQIEQVILNLMRNAVEAMSGGGPRRVLQVTTRVSRPDHVEVAVRDTGPGLPPGAADLVFEPFFSTKSTGLGMGLSISRTIVQAHHGRLWAAANEEGGTTFRIELPTPAALRAGLDAASDTDAPAKLAAAPVER